MLKKLLVTDEGVHRLLQRCGLDLITYRDVYPR